MRKRNWISSQYLQSTHQTQHHDNILLIKAVNSNFRGDIILKRPIVIGIMEPEWSSGEHSGLSSRVSEFESHDEQTFITLSFEFRLYHSGGSEQYTVVCELIISTC